MKKMKKTLAMILTLCMIMTALGTCAFADGGYQIQVVDEAGSPVEGVMVQFCSNEQCLVGKTGADGIASFDEPAGSYTIHLLKLPAGYAKDTTEYPAPETPDTVVLTVHQEGSPAQASAAANDGAKPGAAEPEVLDVPQLGLHYETLHGDKEGLSSVKVNAQYRIEFREILDGDKTIAEVVSITELSNHYK